MKNEANGAQSQGRTNKRRIWTTLVIPAFVEDPILTDREKIVLLALDLCARGRCWCFHGNQRLGAMTNKKVRTVQEILASLEAKGYLDFVYDRSRKSRRLGIVFLKRIHPNVPAATTPDQVKNAITELCCYRAERKHRRMDRVRISGKGGCGNPHTEEEPRLNENEGLTSSFYSAPTPVILSVRSNEVAAAAFVDEDVIEDDSADAFEAKQAQKQRAIEAIAHRLPSQSKSHAAAAIDRMAHLLCDILWDTDASDKDPYARQLRGYASMGWKVFRGELSSTAVEETLADVLKGFAALDNAGATFRTAIDSRCRLSEADAKGA